jgi:CheY-like chemotaxis protein
MNGQRKIFMVDDDADDQQLFSDTLFSIDPSITCITKDGGEQALQVLIATDDALPDFIFVDLNMPAMNGFEFLEAVKHLPSLQHIPVIIYTTSSEPKQKEQAMKLGASGFLTKPSCMRELKNELQKLISTRTLDFCTT